MTEALRSISIGIGGVTTMLHLGDPVLADLISTRYAGFIDPVSDADYHLEIETVAPNIALGDPDEDVEVRRDGDLWRVSRGDFRAEWDVSTRRGRVRQTANPYSIDTVLRILHTLVLAPRGGFLLHAASVLRGGRAHMFSGVSGAGKTTISRLAPPDVTLLTDEISYITRVADGYRAFGTPFAGDLGRPGDNVSAPLAALYLIAHGDENRISDIESPATAARALLGNILFFAHGYELVEAVFESALEFVQHVPVKRLAFLPDKRIWSLIQ